VKSNKSTDNIIIDICPSCRALVKFEVILNGNNIILKCLSCGFKKTYPRPYPENWREQGMSINEVVETTRRYGIAMFLIMESGICPLCKTCIPPENRKIEKMYFDEPLNEWCYEENIRCPKCRVNFGWASFMKLIESFPPVREFLKYVRSFNIECDDKTYYIFNKETFRIKFKAKDKVLIVYMDKSNFEPIWMESNLTTGSL